MPPENEPRPAAPSPREKVRAVLAEKERLRKEMERRNARRAHKPNLKTIPWKK